MNFHLAILLVCAFLLEINGTYASRNDYKQQNTKQLSGTKIVYYKTRRDCKISACSKEFKPVCAINCDLKRTQNFANPCLLRAYECRHRINFPIVLKGACVVAKYKRS
ncbi:hypothetical protein C0J52_12798 [Blattella germanica]|nr:hypothetical protein C0J52_12798 [Blattella germanica]